MVHILYLLDCDNWASKQLDCNAGTLLCDPDRAVLKLAQAYTQRTKKREGGVVRKGVKNEAHSFITLMNTP